ncbi:MAG TPA: zinc ribbon domain-containing protein, partial [Nitrososphaeraceae archaeon]|nr:zinc ribbon domain-containing protein [Nitrososphaeraceae archaeon]
VVRLAKAARKTIIQALKEEEKKQKLVQREIEKQRAVIVKQLPSQEQQQKPLKVKPAIIICLQCNKDNAQGSKFCNYCGAKLQNSCSNCGNINPENSAFCNQCGLALA